MLDRHTLLDTQKHYKTTKRQRTARETYSIRELEMATHRNTDKTRTNKMKVTDSEDVVGIQRLQNR